MMPAATHHSQAKLCDSFHKNAILFYPLLWIEKYQIISSLLCSQNWIELSSSLLWSFLDLAWMFFSFSAPHGSYKSTNTLIKLIFFFSIIMNNELESAVPVDNKWFTVELVPFTIVKLGYWIKVKNIWNCFDNWKNIRKSFCPEVLNKVAVSNMQDHTAPMKFSARWKGSCSIAFRYTNHKLRWRCESHIVAKICIMTETKWFLRNF